MEVGIVNVVGEMCLGDSRGWVIVGVEIGVVGLGRSVEG